MRGTEAAREDAAAEAPAAQSPGPGLPLQRLAAIRRLETWHFWFKGRDLLVRKFIPAVTRAASPAALDLGCGSGRFAASLSAQGYAVVGVDLSGAGIEQAGRDFPQVKFACSPAEKLSFADDSFGLVTALDVFEHTEDERSLAEAWRVLKPGGILVLTVPALPWLYGYRDLSAGHRRRYTKDVLQGKLKNAGFMIEDMRYMNCLLLPLLAASRILGRNSARWRDREERLPPLLNEFFMSVAILDVWLGLEIRYPAGSTLVALCRK